ncbi:FMN-binding protein MioC [Apirhabdus apintestini]|uniref:FMN-binding protein MioC n=1 Tax=Erwinia sp. HR93 TaxID=3094840 RepID=UPI002ADEECCD|nr:FMN-binding protein MioC [Erwinia sp. HR93]MEA1062881.1 FMN-binding protein MioC [Erwinia sp. HR93]WPM84774.1 FMN-binding protein MioC [Enterobacteriaceae bacterium CA-0114]
MADITLISGSTLGNAEYVAEHLAEKLDEMGYTSDIRHGPTLDELTAEGTWLIITSTHGAGDLPDNLQPWFDALNKQRPNLSAVKYGAVGIGSREYDTFCGAIEKCDLLLNELGAQRIGETLKINVLEHEIPEDPAEEWLHSWAKLLKEL